MNVVKRSWMSLVQQGPARTMQTVVSIVGDHWFDWRYGTDTVREVALDELGIAKRDEGALDYQASRTRYFHKLLERIDAQPGSVFVDLGAGKGRTVMLAAEHGYRRAVGVEFSAALCEAGRRNIAQFRKRRPVTTEMVMVQADAAEYPIGDDENVFYVTAFGTPTLSRVLDNIVASIRRAPRTIKLAYHNPYSPEVIESHPAFVKLDAFVYGSATALLFTNRQTD